MQIGRTFRTPPGESGEGWERAPRPIRPKGASSRLPFILFIALLAGLFIGYRSLAESEFYRTAETFVRQSPELKEAVGEIRSCRLWFPLRVDLPEDKPRAHLTLAVDGTKASTKVQVALIRGDGKWRVVAATYEDRKGALRTLPIGEKPPAGAVK
jgi:hypothetical protein